MDALEYHKIHAHAKTNTNSTQSSLGKRKTGKNSDSDASRDSKVIKKELTDSKETGDDKAKQLSSFKSSTDMNNSPASKTISTKKSSAPVAVLRPLVPQHGINTQDSRKTITHTATSDTNRNSIGRNVQQYYNGKTAPSHIGRPHPQPAVVSGKQRRSSKDSRTNNQSFVPGMISSVQNRPGTQGCKGDLATYSDISDASDQEDEAMGRSRRQQVDQQVTRSDAVSDHGSVSRGIQQPPALSSSLSSTTSIEERLFCNEELVSNSPPPPRQPVVAPPSTTPSSSRGPTPPTPSVSKQKVDKQPTKKLQDGNPSSRSVSNRSQSPVAPVMTSTSSPHFLPHPGHHPPPLAYPYFPFMPGQIPHGNMQYPPSSQPGMPMAAIYGPYMTTYPGMQPYIHPHPPGQSPYGPMPFNDRNQTKPEDRT